MMFDERGSSLLSVLVVGALVLFMVIQTLLAAGRLQLAAEAAGEATRHGVTHAARYGDVSGGISIATELAPGGRIEMLQTGPVYSMKVVIAVPIFGPDRDAVSMEVSGEARAVESRYRSHDGQP